MQLGTWPFLLAKICGRFITLCSKQVCHEGFSIFSTLWRDPLEVYFQDSKVILFISISKLLDIYIMIIQH